MLVLNATCVVIADDLFVKKEHIERCVSEVNTLPNEALTTSDRLYVIGKCYLCAGCVLEEDDGRVFSQKNVQLSTNSKHLGIAYNLMQQSAELSNAKASYGLAYIMYISDLASNRLTKDEIIAYESSLKEENEHIDEKTDIQLEEQIYTNTHEMDFSIEIHTHLYLAAKQGHLAAQFALAEVYYRGIGVIPNPVQSYAWAATAVAQNPPFGSERRDRYALELNSFEINEAESLAVEYMKNHTSIFDDSSVAVAR